MQWKNKLYSFLGDILAALHFLFILYVVAGAAAVNYFPSTIWLHLPCVIWGFSVQYFDWTCPLTYAEKFARKRSGEEAGEQGFVAHHLNKIMYPGFMSRKLNYILAFAVIIFNLIGYALLYFLI